MEFCLTLLGNQSQAIYVFNILKAQPQNQNVLGLGF